MLHYLARWSTSTPALDPAPFDGYVRGSGRQWLHGVEPAAYVNYLDSAITDYGDAYWPGTYSGLRSIKRNVDPGNLYTFPQSVRA